MTNAYNTLANSGNLTDLYFIRKVLDSNGNILYEHEEKEEMVLKDDITFILNELLTSTYDESLIDYEFPTCYAIKNKMTHKYSIKTGTTDSDYLIFGYNNDALLGIWAGFDDNRNVSPYGGQMLKNTWINSIEYYLKDKETTWYDKPSNVVGVLVNPITGKLAGPTSENTKIMYYLKGSEPIIRE